MHVLNEHITEDSIKVLVDQFYTKIRIHPELGPIFNSAIGHDDASWTPHLQLLYDFWSSLMLRTGRYHGNPHAKHRDLPTFDVGLFDSWLDLFAQTAHEVYAPSIAQKFIQRSQNIAESLKLSVQKP